MRPSLTTFLISGHVCADLTNIGPRGVSRHMQLKTTCSAILACLLAAPKIYAFGLPASSLRINAGPVGALQVSGILSGYGFLQDNPSPESLGLLGSRRGGVAISNAFLIIQKKQGPIQFYLQTGTYGFPQIGAPFSSAQYDTTAFGPLLWAYMTIAPSKSFSFEIGKLPVLYGYNGTLTYARNTIEGGLLWAIEPSVNRGVQANFSHGPINVSLSLNDGYYSGQYNWLDGLFTYTFDATNNVNVYAGGNFSHTETLAQYQAGSYSNNPYVNATLGLDNSDIYGIYFEHTAGRLCLVPEIQMVYTPASRAFGTTRPSRNLGVAFHLDYSYTKTWSLGADIDYASTNGAPGDGRIGGGFLGYGNGARAWAVALTPTYQRKHYFIREELSLAYVPQHAPGKAFGNNGSSSTQVRVMAETGYTF